MKVGGNQAFKDYITKHGRGMVTASSNAKEKYTSAAAQSYRDELKRRAKEDELRYGSGPVTTEGIANASHVTDSKENGKNGAGDDDDFFDSWDKPTNIIAPSPSPSPKPMLGGPPRVGLSPAATPQGSRPTTPSVSATASPSGSATLSPSSAAAAPAPAVSRAISSSSVRASSAGSGARAGAMKLGGGKSKLGGVKKGGAAINFEEAERKAREEEERIKRLGYDREQEAKAAAEAAAAAASASARASPAPSSSRGEMVGNKQSSGEVDRLGMGFGRLGFGQVAGLSGEEAAKAAAAAKRAANRANNPEPG